ncbi:hypothetical protein [Micromonospora sp. LOL_024]|uniref:hypothetical protein n=1 Tax=Micromonospora sp. LOL_024 TaxID=3345412 RepID=UPI003A84E610
MAFRVAVDPAAVVRLGATGREDEAPATDDEAVGADGDTGTSRDDRTSDAGVTRPPGGCGAAADGGSAVGQSAATMRPTTALAVPTSRSR